MNETKIKQIRSSTLQFNGYGKVHITCDGEGDNSTLIYWNRTDKDGHHLILNVSRNELYDTTWSSELFDNPYNRSKFPYFYQCVVENKCCPTLRSLPLKMTYFPAPDSKKVLF